MNRRELLRLLACSPLLASTAATAWAKDTTYDTFRSRYGGLTSISLRYSGDLSKGTLKARKGGWYHVDLGDKVFISNSKTTWHVQRSTKTVIVDTYKSSSDQASIDQIFFVVFNVYAHKGTKDLGKGRKQLTLAAPSKSAVVAGIDQLDIVVSGKMMVESIVVTEAGSKTTWKISDVILDPALPDSVFTYAAPKDWQVVDLR